MAFGAGRQDKSISATLAAIMRTWMKMTERRIWGRDRLPQ